MRKYRFGKSSIKMYDKSSIVLCIETTTNDVSFFKHHRRVEHPDSLPTRELAPVKKSIYSLIDLREILLGCNRRYIAHLSALDDVSAGIRALSRLIQPHAVDSKTVKGSTSSSPAIPRCCMRRKVRGSASPVSVGPILCPTSQCCHRTGH